MASLQKLKWLRLVAACFLVGCGPILLISQSSPGDRFEDLLKKGFQLHRESRYGEAIPVLEQARKLEPTDYFANLLLGIDLLRTGNATDAVVRLKLAAVARPGEEFPEDYLGEAEATLGNQALAAEAFQQAVIRGRNSEQSLEAWAGFALERFSQIGETLRETEEGLAIARRLQKDADSADANAAGHSVVATNCARSISVLERKLAVRSEHLDADAAYRLSTCYAVEAGKAADRLQSGVEDIGAVHQLRGDVLFRLKRDAAAAKEEYKQALTTHPRDPALLERMAEAQLSAGDPEAAKESAQAALAIDPHRRAALHAIAEIAMTNRDYDQALPPLRQLAAEAPNDRADQVQLGRALAQTDQPEEAFKWLGPALAAGYPDEKGALHALLASVLRKLGRDEEASKAAAEARRLSDKFQAQSTHSKVPDGN
jgi:predicted Zn-dependent protease